MANSAVSAHRPGQITPEALDTLRARIGVIEPVRQPFIRYVNRDSAWHAALAVGDRNPLYVDPQYAAGTRYGKLVCPPYALYGVHWGAWDFRRGDGLPGVHALHSGDEWEFYRPLLDGDEVHATKMLLSLEEMQGRWAGRQYLQTKEVKFLNQRDEVVARLLMRMIRGDRGEAKGRGKYADLEAARYTTEELEELDRQIAAEQVRGGEPRYWDDVAIGETLQPIVRGPLGQNDMIAWRMAMGGGHIRTGQYWLEYRRRTAAAAPIDPATGIPQPVARVHWDDAFARSIGMPAAYDMGSQRSGWALHFLTNWVSDEGFVCRAGIQLRSMNFVGDTTWFKGTVAKKWRADPGGHGFVAIDFQGVNQRGTVTLTGSAVVALPRAPGNSIQFPIESPITPNEPTTT